MRNQLSIIITVITLLIGFATGIQAEVPTNADVDPQVEEAYKRLATYRWALNHPKVKEVHKGPMLETLKTKVEEALKNLDNADIGKMQIGIGEGGLLKAQADNYKKLQKIKWDQENGAQEVLEDIQKLGETLKKYKSEMKK